MYAMNRVNRIGIKFTLVELNAQNTEIRTGAKFITVQHNIHKLSQSWYDWIQHGQMVQHAFDYLTMDEREFILSGLTIDEFNELTEQQENN